MHPTPTSQQRPLVLPFLSWLSASRLLRMMAGFFVLGMALWATVGLAQAHQAPSSGRAPRAESLTQDLIALSTRYQLAGPATQAQLLGSLLTVAAERQQLLTALSEGDPGEVLQLALPADLRAGLPAAVQALVEEAVEVEGELEVLHEDHDTGDRYLYFLQTTSARLALHFAFQPPTDLATGSRVRVSGLRVGQALALDSGRTSVQTMSAALPNTFGAQSTLVLLVNFADNPTQPYPVSTAQSVFTTTSNFDWENSYQQALLSGVVDTGQAADVRGWYTIALGSTVCDYNTLASQAKAAAQAAGVNLAAYSRYVYAFPQNACTWWGLGSVGGNPSQAWINGSLQLRVTAHEMGHNWGLYHAHSLSCDPSGCTASEYGDSWDDMGGAVGHYNAFQKERLGWLNYGVSPPLIPVTASGPYWLERYEPTSANPKALKIWKSTDPGTGQNTYYYVEYRGQQGFDSSLASAVLVHTGTEGSGNSSNLWDLAPTSTTSDWVLNVDQSYTDAQAGVTLSTVSADSTGATVQVTFGPVPCAGANPTVALTPSGTQSVAAGGSVSYTVSVTDNDSASCAAATFTLQASAPPGWTAAFATASLSLSPGSTGTTTLTLTVPSTASGLYSIPVTAANGSYVGTTSASVSVSAPCVNANPTVALAPTSQGGVPGGTVSYTVTVVDTDSASCPAATFTLQAPPPNGWAAAFASTTLPLSPGASGATTLTVTAPASAPAGSYSIPVTATNSGALTYVAMASATDVVVTSLSVSVQTDKTSYKANAPVQLTATVRAVGSPVVGAGVTFTITKPDGTKVTLAATSSTNSSGTAGVTWTAKTRASGTYQVQAVATLNTASGSGTTSFTVQ